VRGVLSVGEFQRDVRPSSADRRHVGRLRADARRPLRAVRLLRRLFDGRHRPPRVALLRPPPLRRPDTRARAVQGPPVPQGPRRLHGRHLPVRHRSVRPPVFNQSINQSLGPFHRAIAVPLCHALSLSSLSMLWTSMRRRRATVPLAISAEWA